MPTLRKGHNRFESCHPTEQHFSRRPEKLHCQKHTSRTRLEQVDVCAMFVAAVRLVQGREERVWKLGRNTVDARALLL